MPQRVVSTKISRNSQPSDTIDELRTRRAQVGLEPYVDDKRPTNVELVEEVVALEGRYERPVATPGQTAEILHLPNFPVCYRPLR